MPRRVRIFVPPVRQAAGGVAVLMRIAEALHDAGMDTALVRREPGWTPSGVGEAVPVLDWDAHGLRPDDLWIVPEGWVNALAPGLQAKARCLVYVQNWAYLFSALPEGVDWRQLAVDFLAVSEPVARFVRETIGAEPRVLRPGIDTELFQDREKASETIRIAFMPRKNKALVERIRQTVEVMLRGPGQDDLPGIEWVPIAGLDAAGVAAALGSAHVFLASGFPEGCPLPPLEAMASGCVVAGFAGYGGFDYMRPGLGFPGEYTPWFPLREVPWGPNGLFCADADVLAAANALVRAVRMCAQSGEELEKTRANARLTAEHYALDVHRASALKTLTHFTD